MTEPFAGQAFGLTFHCQQVLPELTPCARSTAHGSTVSIDWLADTAPAPALNLDLDQGLFRGTPSSFDLRVPGIAGYHVTAERIAISPAPGVAPGSVRAFLFGSALGALLQLRGLTVLHGSAVQRPDGTAAVFCGSSTAGKSTLAAALAQRGHPLLSDDLTALRFDGDGQVWCLPGLARTKLWRHALDALGLADQAHAGTQVRPDLDKYSLPFGLATQPAPLRRFYELRAHEQGELAFSEVKGLAKFNVLMAHTFRPTFLPAMGLQAQHLRRISALVPLLSVSRIDRPRSAQTLDAISSQLEDEWQA